jgi:molecular chaperone GrpE (heat shock protein)
MNERQAIARLKKLLGKNLAYRVDSTALVGEEREEAKEQRAALAAEHQAVKAALEARRQAVLAADAAYQRLRAEYDRTKAAADKAAGKAFARRITVGTAKGVGGLSFFSVQAEADNWTEAVEIIERKST